MNRENEEQRPVSQTLCGALQKEPNCKCLVLSVLIYGCLAAVTWCRCANVTKIMVNFTRLPIKSTKHVSSPCDDGYIYIPVAFMGMLYLVYLVECYHSPIRLDLLHAESQDNILSKLMQLKMAQPTIWWKAVSYHYVRRKRQITRYRNGDNYTTTQVYYERVNTHAATSVYYYDYCGVKDISKELMLEPKIPITKIMLTKGFAFSNMRSATEFEEARSRFFAEQELRDDYMEMREGLDLGYNVNPTMLVAVLGNPWFTNRYVYWCLSALLLSWPLRVIIEYKTQYADYQVTKLFGINYDTPTTGEPIHASISQLSQPGSYMLAPSYSEALLMDPAPSNNQAEQNQEDWQIQRETEVASDMVPSYSEALLYERAERLDNRNVMNMNNTIAFSNMHDQNRQMLPVPCECHCPCPCHMNTNYYDISTTEDRSYVEILDSDEHLPLDPPITNAENNDTIENQTEASQAMTDGRLSATENVPPPYSMEDLETGISSNRCGTCGRISISTQTTNTDVAFCVATGNKPNESCQTLSANLNPEKENESTSRDISESNLIARSELANGFAKGNIANLGNILENEEELMGSARADSTNVEDNFPNERPLIYESQGRNSVPLPSSLMHSRSLSLEETDISPRNPYSKGAIPKCESRSRIMVNPMSSEARWKLPNSKTYFCLKSILKQNKRRYTLVTTDEFQNITDQNVNGNLECSDRSNKNDCNNQYDDHKQKNWDIAENSRMKLSLFEESTLGRDKAHSNDQKGESTRTLIFASPIQEVFPGDPFGGKNVIPTRNSTERISRDDPTHAPIFGRLGRSPTDRDRRRGLDKHPRAFSIQQEHPIMYPFPHSHAHQQQYTRKFPTSIDYVDDIDVRTNETTSQTYRNEVSIPSNNELLSDDVSRNPIPSSNEFREDRLANTYSPNRRRHQFAGLSRSLTERRPRMVRPDKNFRRSFTGRVEDYRTEGSKRTIFSMETSL